MKISTHSAAGAPVEFNVGAQNDDWVRMDTTRGGYTDGKKYVHAYVKPEVALELAAALTDAANEVIDRRPKLQHGFKVGQRVVVDRYGVTTAGTVVDPDPNGYHNELFVHVLLDGDITKGGWYPKNVKADPFGNA